MFSVEQAGQACFGPHAGQVCFGPHAVALGRVPELLDDQIRGLSLVRSVNQQNRPQLDYGVLNKNRINDATNQNALVGDLLNFDLLHNVSLIRPIHFTSNNLMIHLTTVNSRADYVQTMVFYRQELVRISNTTLIDPQPLLGHINDLPRLLPPIVQPVLDGRFAPVINDIDAELVHALTFVTSSIMWLITQILRGGL